MRPAARAWLLACLLALAWGVGPALPTLLRGELLGHAYTDLYPSVWGMWDAATATGIWPSHTQQIAAPDGMPFYYSSPLHGWLARALLPVLSVPASWNFGVVAARIATVLCSFGAARAWGLRGAGALLAATVYACSPFFQGYAVEGIVEGLDGWTLALALWSYKTQRHALTVLAFGLTLLSSWYLGAVACVGALLLGPRAWATAIGGLLVALPGLMAFSSFAPELAPMEPELRAMMGTQLGPWTPGVSAGLNPFAKTSWIGFVVPVVAAFSLRRWRWVGAAVLLFVVLSFGVGPWYGLPPFSMIRFPYRFIAGALVGLAYLAGQRAQGWRYGGWLVPLVLAESLLLSPIEALIPGAPAEIDSVYQELPEAQVLLDIPGPVAMPPGQMNPSRSRARWFLYQQTGHGMASPWAPDFNGVGTQTQDHLDSVRALDPLTRQAPPTHLEIPQSVDLIVVHPKELRGSRAATHALLERAGWRLTRTGQRDLYERK